jgi:LPPG:FO 2-phospho-L-lactate transferase
MADAMLHAIGVEVSAAAVAVHYGARHRGSASGGVIDGWLVHTSDADQLESIESAGIAARAVPLLMSDIASTAQMAKDAVDLAVALATGTGRDLGQDR